MANLFFFALLPNKADVPIKTLIEKEAIISCLKSSAVNHRRVSFFNHETVKYNFTVKSFWLS